MIDEFRAARELAQAQMGFIVCAEAPPNEFRFKGTISVDEDTREVLRAAHSRLPERPEDTSRGLEEAFALYHEGGRSCCLPQTVLEFSTPLGRLVEASKPGTPQVKRGTGRARNLVRLINSEKSTLLWQCGYLSDEGRISSTTFRVEPVSPGRFSRSPGHGGQISPANGWTTTWVPWASTPSPRVCDFLHPQWSTEGQAGPVFSQEQARAGRDAVLPTRWHARYASLR